MRMSEQIESQIHETQNRLQSIDNEMEAVQQAFLLKAANGEAYDSKAVVALEKDRGGLQREREFLTLRLDALQAQHAEAVKGEAQERAAEIEKELTARTKEGAAAYGRFLHLREKIIETIQELGETLRQTAEIKAEAAYLHEAYDTPWPQSGEIPQPTERDIFPIKEALQALFSARTAGVQWQIAIDRLRDARTQEPQPDGVIINDVHRYSNAEVLQRNQGAHTAQRTNPMHALLED